MQEGTILERTGTALRRLIAGLLARPLLLGLALVVVTALAATQAVKLRTEVDLSGLVDPDSAAVEGMRDYQARFGRISSDEVLLVTTSSLADDDALLALEDLLIELQFADGVETVISLMSIPAPGRASSWLATPEMQALDPRTRLERMRAQNPLAAQLLSEDLSATLIAVVPARGTPEARLLPELHAALATADPQLEIANVGLSEVHRSIGRELIRDLRVLTPAAVVLCMVLTALIFRSLSAVAVCTMPAIIGLGWFFGWLGASGTAVDPVIASLPVVLIVLCFSDCMHIYHAAIAAMRRGLGHRAAVVQSLVETSPAAVLTSVTTVVAFVSLTFPSAPALNDMGRAGIVGMVLCLASALLVTPVLMLVLHAPRAGAVEPRSFAALVPPALRWSRRVRLVPVLAGLVLVALIAVQSQSRVGFRYNEYLPVGAPVSAALARMEALGLGSDRLFVVVESLPLAIDPGTDDPAQANALAAAQAIWGQGHDRADWLDPLRANALFDRLAADDGSAHALPVQLPITSGTGPADAALSALEARLAGAGLADVTRVVGPSHALLTEGPKLVVDLRFGLYLTILSITVLIGVVFRSARIALVALVANLIPILGVETWLVLTGRDLTIMNVIALTVAFGIAVDDTLHLLNRFRLARGADTPERVEVALAHAGPPMVATTAILLGGLVVTLFSALPGVAIYGTLIALAVSMALAADLFLLPGLLKWSLK